MTVDVAKADGPLRGKVAVISGAARGQGRSHVVTLAREGAAIVAFDLCEKIEHALTPAATEADLDETKQLVEEAGGECLAVKADARDLGGMTLLAEQTVERFGRVDILLVNHGIWTVARNSWELEEDVWQETIDHVLTGAWKVCKAFIPQILAGGRGGSIAITSSSNAVAPLPGSISYCAAKAAEIQMMRVLAKELGPSRVRVNAILPGGIDTPMSTEGGTAERVLEHHPEYRFERTALPAGLLSPQSISDAISWLVSDRAAYVTGVALPVDAGNAVY